MPQVLLHILTEPDVCCEVWLHSVPAVSTFAEMRLVVAFLMSVVTVEGWVPCFCTPHPTPPHPTPTPPHPPPSTHCPPSRESSLSAVQWWAQHDDGNDQGLSSEEVGKELVRVNFWKLQTGGSGWEVDEGFGGGGCWDPLISSGKIMWQTNSHTSIHTIRWLGSSSNAAERESLACWC